MKPLTSEQLKRRGLPKTRGRLHVEGLGASVSVIRDPAGCVHINAHTEHDVWFANGFCHAQDRLWQMERTRRFARGTLSEILGEALIPVDKRYRRLGIRVVSERDWPQLNGTARGILQSFADGVNAAVDSMKQLPPEFEVLDLVPGRWHPVDSIALWKVIFLTQTNDYNLKLLRAALARKLGPEGLAVVEPGYPDEAPVACPPGSTAEGLGAEAAEMTALAERLAPLSAGEGGSNNWAVDGTLSASGKPLLAGDPHAVVQVAPVWYMNHLRTPEWEMIGGSTPGVPGIFLYGHNGRVGWTVTNAVADIADIFVERFDEQNRKYLYRGAWREAEFRHEEIHVKGRAEPVIEDIPVTVHGPLISGGPLGPGVPLSWQWTAHGVVTTFECIPGMARARNVDEFRESQRHWGGPPMNRITADDSGNIAYQLLGDIPVRAHGGGNTVPAPGWTGEYDWTGTIPFSALPWSKNPERHFVASANNRVVPAGYPYHVNDLTPAYRAWRIDDLLREKQAGDLLREKQAGDLLREKQAFTVDDFKGIQGDRWSRPAAEFVRILNEMGLDGNAMDLLRDWDGVIGTASAPAALYEAFMQKLLARVWAFAEGLPGIELGLGRLQLCHLPKLLRLIASDDRSILRLNEATSRMSWREVLADSLAEAEAALKERLGDDASRWTWGQLHHQTFVHNLGRTPPHDATFNMPPVEIGGDSTTVFAAGANYRKDFAVAGGVSFRMIVDFDDLDRSVWALPPGQSGHPGSPHYDDGIQPWLNMEYHPMMWDWERIKANQEGALWLLPATAREEA